MNNVVSIFSTLLNNDSGRALIEYGLVTGSIRPSATAPANRLANSSATEMSVPVQR